MDLFNLEISLKWMNIIKISKKTILKKKFNFRIYKYNMEKHALLAFTSGI